MNLQQRIDSGEDIVVAEVSPPQSGNPAPLRAAAKQYAGKVHALGVSDNENGVCMSALAAAALVAQAGLEPILHVVTRDRNRTALVADYLGAQALGIANVLCTSGTHQTLGAARAARAVFDLDSIQLLKAYASLGSDASVVGVERINGAAPLYLGAVATPFADPPELQLIRLAKKAQAGAKFAITQAVEDVEQFSAWWKQVTAKGLHQKLAILAGVRVSGGGTAKAVETVKRLQKLDGLRGFEIRGGGDDAAALEVIAKTGIGAS